MAIAAKDVMALRKRTGLGMMECKAALNEADGDMDKAVEVLREKLGKKMDDRADREAVEGAIAAAVGQDAAGNQAVAMILLKSETDFAARNDSFVAGAQKIADLALQGPDGDVEATDEMNEVVENLRITIKENISVGKGVKLSGPKAGAYVHHNRRVGAIVTGEGDLSDDLLKGVCQHLVAADGRGMLPMPIAIDETDLPEVDLAKAKQDAVEEAVATGKPQQIAEKIAEGKLRKWKDDHTLLGQLYLREMDAKKPIRDYIPKDAKLIAFRRYEL